MSDDEIRRRFPEALAQVPAGWWWTVGRCELTCHASVGPDRAHVPEPMLSLFDAGFHADLPNPSTVAAALLDACAQAHEAIRQWEERP